MASAMRERPLQGLRVLVVEDDYFIAVELCSALRAAGADVLGPELRARDIPIIFATGYDASMIPAELTDTPRLEKPVDLAALCLAIETACRL